MIKYEISYSVERLQWELWKITNNERSIDIRCIYSGTKSNCQKELKRLSNEKN